MLVAYAGKHQQNHCNVEVTPSQWGQYSVVLPEKCVSQRYGNDLANMVGVLLCARQSARTINLTGLSEEMIIQGQRGNRIADWF